jgi:hypothetical protein
MRTPRTLVIVTVLALALAAALPPAAPAMNDGRGFYGPTDDKVVTWAGLILVVFFPLFIFFASRLQALLDRRKEARRAAERAQTSSPFLRGGW